jgi:hypothetical protein
MLELDSGHDIAAQGYDMIPRSCGLLPDGRTPGNGHIPAAGLQRRFTEAVTPKWRFTDY